MRNAQSAMRFSQIGKLTPRSVAQGSIDVTVEPFSLGKVIDKDYTIMRSV